MDRFDYLEREPVSTDCWELRRSLFHDLRNTYMDSKGSANVVL